MKTCQGSSLIEVLLSLLLISSIAITSLKQQWQMKQLLNQVLTRANAATELTNETEKLIAGQTLSKSLKPGSNRWV